MSKPKTKFKIGKLLGMIVFQNSYTLCLKLLLHSEKSFMKIKKFRWGETKETINTIKKF